MNRLILLGNGFDLAHGFKTKYEDFLLHLLQKAISEIYYNKKFVLPNIFECERNCDEISLEGLEDLLHKNNSISNCLKFLKSKEVKFRYLNIFSEKLFNYSQNNWVDIEELYFEELKNEFNGKYIRDSTDVYSLLRLNNALESIKNELSKYLSNIFQVQEMKFNEKIGRSLFEPLNLNEFMLNNYSIDNAIRINGNGIYYPQNIYFLNFNYTQTFRRYIDERGQYVDNINYGNSNVLINNIHGLYDEPENMIFGYGDEIDEDYKIIEKSKQRDYLEHIKSFKYLKNRNYRNLMNFIDNRDFQVYVMGHSCGISDRVMLKRIFENSKCKSIKIFYHDNGDNGIKDFTRKTYDIALHFEDNTIMREKIVPKEMLFPLGG